MQLNYLDENGNNTQSANNGSVVRFACQNVQSSDGSFDDFFHANSIGIRALGLSTARADHRRALQKKKKLPTLNQKTDSAARLEVTYSLNVLESTDEELHQTSYNSLIAQRSVIGRTQSQIANQSNQSCQQIRSMESVKVNRVTTLYL